MIHSAHMMTNGECDGCETGCSWCADAPRCAACGEYLPEHEDDCDREFVAAEREASECQDNDHRDVDGEPDCSCGYLAARERGCQRNWSDADVEMDERGATGPMERW